MIAVARNIVVDIAKSSWTRYAVFTGELPDGIGPHDAPEQDVLDAFDHTAVLLGLGELTLAQRECLWLRFYANLSVDEVGERMGRNRTSVRALQYRAVRRLAEVLPPWVYSADGERQVLSDVRPARSSR